MSEVRQILKINNFEVWVNLGCSVQEQANLQPVSFTLELKFLKNLSGCHTDKLTDATDYVLLTQIMKNTATVKAYHLIEHMNQCVFDKLVDSLKQQQIFAEVILTIRKLRVPVENLKDGVEFTCQQMLS